MKRGVLFSALLALSFIAQADDGVHQSIVSVTARVDGKTRLGSGVSVAPGLIATNCHIVNNAKQIWLDTKATSDYGKVVFEDSIYDVCLVTIDSKLTPVEFAASSSIGKDALVTAESGEGRLGSAKIIEVFNYPHYRAGPKMSRISMKCVSGNSGSSVFDENGRLLGMIVLKYDEDDTCLFLPVEIIRQSLAHYNKSFMTASGAIKK